MRSQVPASEDGECFCLPQEPETPPAQWECWLSPGPGTAVPQSPVLAPSHPQGEQLEQGPNSTGTGVTSPSPQEDECPHHAVAPCRTHHGPVNGLEQALFSPWDLVLRAWEVLMLLVQPGICIIFGKGKLYVGLGGNLLPQPYFGITSVLLVNMQAQFHLTGDLYIQKSLTATIVLSQWKNPRKETMQVIAKQTLFQGKQPCVVCSSWLTISTSHAILFWGVFSHCCVGIEQGFEIKVEQGCDLVGFLPGETRML